jgi:hypothetical protein
VRVEVWSELSKNRARGPAGMRRFRASRGRLPGSGEPGPHAPFRSSPGSSARRTRGGRWFPGLAPGRLLLRHVARTSGQSGDLHPLAGREAGPFPRMRPCRDVPSWRPDDIAGPVPSYPENSERLGFLAFRAHPVYRVPLVQPVPNVQTWQRVNFTVSPGVYTGAGPGPSASSRF